MLNTTNLSNSFHSQTSLKDTIFSVLISGLKNFMNGLRNTLTDKYVLFIWYKHIYFSLPLNPAIHRMGNTPNILCPRCKGQEESKPCFTFFVSFPKLLWDFISELINLKHAFKIPFKITLRTIIMGTSFQFHDDVQLNILPKDSEFGSKETFVQGWSYHLNNNGNLNIQFN